MGNNEIWQTNTCCPDEVCGEIWVEATWTWLVLHLEHNQVNLSTIFLKVQSYGWTTHFGSILYIFCNYWKKVWKIISNQQIGHYTNCMKFVWILGEILNKLNAQCYQKWLLIQVLLQFSTKRKVSLGHQGTSHGFPAWS